MRAPLRWIAAAALLASACAASQPVEPAPDLDSLVGPGTRPPASEVERGLLPRLGELPEGGQVETAGQTAELGPVYAAASGRRCRTVITADATATACLIDDSWAFVPQVVTVERGGP